MLNTPRSFLAPIYETPEIPVVEGSLEDTGHRRYDSDDVRFNYGDETCAYCGAEVYDIPDSRISLCPSCKNEMFPCWACETPGGCSYDNTALRCDYFDHTKEWKKKHYGQYRNTLIKLLATLDKELPNDERSKAKHNKQREVLMTKLKMLEAAILGVQSVMFRDFIEQALTHAWKIYGTDNDGNYRDYPVSNEGNYTIYRKANGDWAWAYNSSGDEYDMMFDCFIINLMPCELACQTGVFAYETAFRRRIHAEAKATLDNSGKARYVSLAHYIDAYLGYLEAGETDYIIAHDYPLSLMDSMLAPVNVVSSDPNEPYRNDESVIKLLKGKIQNIFEHIWHMYGANCVSSPEFHVPCNNKPYFESPNFDDKAKVDADSIVKVDATEATKKFYFGQYWQVYGTNCIEVPAHFTLEQAIEFVQDKWDDVELASDASYVQCSDEPDFESCHFNDEAD